MLHDWGFVSAAIQYLNTKNTHQSFHFIIHSDPYVVVKLFFESDVVEKKQTQPCRGNLNPVWNEPFVFDWKDGTTTGYRFLFEIKSADMIFPDTTLGKVEICQDDSDHWKEMMNRKNYALAMCHEVEWRIKLGNDPKQREVNVLLFEKRTAIKINKC